MRWHESDSMASNGKHHQAFLITRIRTELPLNLIAHTCLAHLLDKGIAYEASGVRKEGNDNQINVSKYACDFLCSVEERNATHCAHRDCDAWKDQKRPNEL